jgi:hypothetical protein
MELKLESLQQQLAEMPRRLEKLGKSGLKKMTRTDLEALFAGARRLCPGLHGGGGGQ